MIPSEEGYAGVFKPAGGGEPYLLRLRGVDTGADHEVTLNNNLQVFRMSGRDLAS